MSRTRILVALLILVVMLELFPAYSGIIKVAAVALGAVYLAAFYGVRLLVQLRERRAAAALAAADDAEYRRYKTELDDIRAKYDPSRDLGDLTAISQEYQHALDALHDRHQAMLQRKFGPR